MSLLNKNPLVVNYSFNIFINKDNVINTTGGKRQHFYLKQPV